VPERDLSYRELEHGVWCRPDPDGEKLHDAHPRALERWQLAQLFESTNALWDSVLREHRQCGLNELYGDYKTFRHLEYVCPVAAAARAVFGSMNLDGALQGGWPTQTLPLAAYLTLPRPNTVSLEVRRAMLRELPRAWLADALILFGEMARVGRRRVIWEPHPDAFSLKTFAPQGPNRAETVTKRPVKWLEEAVRFTAAGCPNVKTVNRNPPDIDLLLG